jgi:hypothetical protein
MKLVWEKNANRGDVQLVEDHRDAFTRSIGTRWQPGHVVCKWQDRTARGLVIAVIHGDDPHSTSPCYDIELLVLWMKVPFDGNYPSSNPMPLRDGAMDQMETLARLYESQTITAEQARELLELDDDIA